MKKLISLLLTLTLTLGMLSSVMVSSSAASTKRIPKKESSTTTASGSSQTSSGTSTYSYDSSSKTLTVTSFYGNWDRPLTFSTKVDYQNNALITERFGGDLPIAMSELVCSGAIKKITLKDDALTRKFTFTTSNGLVTEMKVTQNSQSYGNSTNNYSFTYSSKKLTKITIGQTSYSISYSNGKIDAGIQYSTNSDGRIVKAYGSDGSPFYTCSYTAKGRIKKITPDDSYNATLTYKYNDNGTLKSYQVSFPGGQQPTYTYNFSY